MRKGQKMSPEQRAKIGMAQTGPKSVNWRGGRIISKKGYVWIMSKGHPGATKDGYVMEHRLVMETIIGRRLVTSEHVHHLNGIKDDNRPENLAILVTRGPHMGWVLCPHCQRRFLIR